MLSIIHALGVVACGEGAAATAALELTMSAAHPEKDRIFFVTEFMSFAPAGLLRRLFFRGVKIETRWARAKHGSPLTRLIAVVVTVVKGLAAEHLLHAARCLPQPLLVLDQRNAHIALAFFAEADAGRHCTMRFGQQPLGEFD
jgi:hypothetical protein